MSRKALHRRLNPTPVMTFAGTELDQVLSGGYNNDLRKELERGNQYLPDSAQDTSTPFVPKEFPLRAVFFNNRCRCGAQSVSFGYFCRKVIEVSPLGEVTRFKVVEASGTPQEIQYQDQIVPYCHDCIPQEVNVVKD